jgi:hypothetical protein
MLCFGNDVTPFTAVLNGRVIGDGLPTYVTPGQHLLKLLLKLDTSRVKFLPYWHTVLHVVERGEREGERRGKEGGGGEREGEREGGGEIEGGKS